MNLRFEPTISFTELLHKALQSPSINCYALSLGLSRNTQPCLQDVQLVLRLITTKSPKWIQVLERLAVLNLELIFGACQQQSMYYPSLISVCHPVNDLAKLSFMQQKLLLLLESHSSHELAWLGLNELIRHYLDNQMHERECELYRRINLTFYHSGSIRSSFELIVNTQPTSDYPERYILNKINVFYNMLLLFKDCCKIYRKRMKYLEFVRESELMIGWIKHCYLTLIQSVTASKHSERNITHDEVADTLKCLAELEGFSELELFAIQANPSIIDFLFSYNLLQPRSQQQAEGQLNFQYGLITGEYGDDLPSFLTRTTVKLSKSQPGFLRSYIKKISEVPQLSQQMMLRVIIVYKELIERRDLVTAYLQPLIQRVMSDLNNLGNYRVELLLSHKLRLLMFYSQVIKESYFAKMLEISVTMLRVEKYTSYNFNEAFNLLQYLCEQLKERKRHLTRASQLIKQHTNWLISQLISIASALYEQYPLSQASEQREGKLNMIFNLLLLVWQKNQRNAEGILPQILRKCCVWVREEAEANWQQGIKSSLIVHTLLKVCRGCLSMISQAYYCDLSDPVYGMLELLKSHNCRDFQQQLLQILTSVIRFEKSITGQSCSLIVQLGRIIEGNKGSLYSVINVLKVLCERQIANSILFDWPELCLFLFNLFVKSIDNINKLYVLNYENEWEEVLVLFGLYIQVFYQFLEDQPSAFEGVEFCVKKIKGSETQFQLMLILQQLKPSRNCQFYRFEALRNIKRRTTFKLLFYYYSHKLLRNYSESLVYQLIDFTKHFRYMSESRSFQNELIIDWPCLEVSPKHCITECFKELKRKGLIDNVDYITYMDNINELLP